MVAAGARAAGRPPTPLDVRDVAASYGFSDTPATAGRLAIIEPRGGYHDADLAAVPGANPANVINHAVNATCDGLPLSGQNSPLDVSTMQRIIAALLRDGDARRVAEQFQANDVWGKFMATLEATLDVQIGAALLPDTAIDVWFTPTHAAGLAAGIDAAVRAGSTAISISWGQSESTFGSARAANLRMIEAALARARQAEVTVCCASGDFGTLNAVTVGDGRARVNYPASSVWSLACGATMLAAGDGAAGGEVVWNAVEYGLAHSSGGGISGVFDRPAYQASLPAPDMTDVWIDDAAPPGFVGRCVPDVAANAGPYGIVLAGEPFAVGGTSASAPLWAALLVRLGAAGGPVGWVNERLYAAGGRGCTDVVIGDDRLPGALRTFAAQTGWDYCTGWGTPRADELARALSGGRVPN